MSKPIRPKSITERFVVPVTIAVTYEDRPGARDYAMDAIARLIDGKSLCGAGMCGGYSLEVVSVGQPKSQRRRNP